MADLTTIILTKNEEANLEECINSIKKISKRIIVVDSYSDDKTLEIAKQHGADIYQNKFINYGAQFQWALDNCEIQTQWVFRFDADERMTSEGSKELEKLCTIHSETNINGFIFKLEVNFLGKKLKHGGTYPFKKLCIFKYGKAYMENRYMDEQIVLTEGKVIEMKSVNIHNDYKDLDFWIKKHNWYATRAAKDFIENSNKSKFDKNLDNPSKIRRILKYRIYYKLPISFRSFMYFVYRYFIRLGFLDGKAGFFYAFFQSYWYRVLVDAKIYESSVLGKTNKDVGSLE